MFIFIFCFGAINIFDLIWFDLITLKPKRKASTKMERYLSFIYYLFNTYSLFILLFKNLWNMNLFWRRDIISPPKTCSNFPRNRQLPYGDEMGLSRNGSVTMTKREVPKCCYRLIVYLMLLGSSRPYPWFILEENGR